MASKNSNPVLMLDIQDAYKVPPIETVCGLYILMADMGISIRESEAFKTLDSPTVSPPSSLPS